MSTEAHGLQLQPEDRKTSVSTVTMAPPRSSAPPETPPLLDPANFRHARLTPNLREMINGLSQPTPDINGPINDLLSSPDPTAMYNSVHMGSPFLRDLYPTQSPMIGMVPPYLNVDHGPESTAQRMERMAGACEEMNALFANITPPNGENRSDTTPEGVISMVSSPEHGQRSVEPVAKASHAISRTLQSSSAVTGPLKKPRAQRSHSSSETPPPQDTSDMSPSVTPEIMQDKPRAKGPSVKKRKTENVVASSRKDPTTQKSKRPSSRPPQQSSAQRGSTGQALRAIAASAPVPASTSASVSASASAMAAANAVAMNSAMASLMPFPGTVPPGFSPHMLANPGTVLYQGRPMAFVAGAHGPELIPVDMLAQATALHFGAAQAAQAASRMMHPMMGSATAPTRASAASFEPVGGSRKKRRRQMLERSGCSEEQARENRARALKRLRQKKTIRSQQNTVRYACRKRIALVRPRVNGRFATKEEVEESQRSEAAQ